MVQNSKALNAIVETQEFDLVLWETQQETIPATKHLGVTLHFTSSQIAAYPINDLYWGRFIRFPAIFHYYPTTILYYHINNQDD